MKRTIRLIGLASVIIFLTAGCAIFGQNPNEKTMELASALTKLSAAAEAYARYETVPPQLTEDQFLRNAVQDDPGLLAPFAGYKMRAIWIDRHAVVLVCSQDGKTAILEDAGCSAPLDNYYDLSFSEPCSFKIRATEICGE